MAPSDPARRKLLAAGGLTLDVPQALASLASPLGTLALFAPRAEAPVLRVEWNSPHAGPAEGATVVPGLEDGWVAVQGGVLRAWTPHTPEGALAALRGAWAEACGRQGGVLLHGAGLAWRNRAVVVTGPPDAGKSTCAELALEAGASLLSDEVLVLFEDGTVQGTPFRSSLRAPPSPARLRCAAVLTLEKAPAESIRPAPPAAFASALLGQVWTPAGLGPGAGEAHRVALRFAGAAFCGTLAFRKHPEAGKFLLEWLDAL